MSTGRFTVAGPACGTCLAELMEAVRTVPGVVGVGVTLLREAPSELTVTTVGPTPAEDVAAAVGAVGFTFAPRVARAPDLQAATTGRIPSLNG
jgi:copper chaperone CopZ